MNKLKFHFGTHQINTLTLDRDSARTEEQNKALLDVLFIDAQIWQAILSNESVNQVYLLRNGSHADQKVLDRHVANGGELFEISAGDQSPITSIAGCIAGSAILVIRPSHTGSMLAPSSIVGVLNIDGLPTD